MSQPTETPVDRQRREREERASRRNDPMHVVNASTSSEPIPQPATSPISDTSFELAVTGSAWYEDDDPTSPLDDTITSDRIVDLSNILGNSAISGLSTPPGSPRPQITLPLTPRPSRRHTPGQRDHRHSPGRSWRPANRTVATPCCPTCTQPFSNGSVAMPCCNQNVCTFCASRQLNHGDDPHCPFCQASISETLIPDGQREITPEPPSPSPTPPSCPICTEQYNGTYVRTAMPCCSQIICTICAARQLGHNPRCPYCRSSIDDSILSPPLMADVGSQPGSPPALPQISSINLEETPSSTAILTRSTHEATQPSLIRYPGQLNLAPGISIIRAPDDAALTTEPSMPAGISIITPPTPPARNNTGRRGRRGRGRGRNRGGRGRGRGQRSTNGRQRSGATTHRNGQNRRDQGGRSNGAQITANSTPPGAIAAPTRSLANDNDRGAWTTVSRGGRTGRAPGRVSHPPSRQTFSHFYMPLIHAAAGHTTGQYAASITGLRAHLGSAWDEWVREYRTDFTSRGERPPNRYVSDREQERLLYPIGETSASGVPGLSNIPTSLFNAIQQAAYSTPNPIPARAPAAQRLTRPAPATHQPTRATASSSPPPPCQTFPCSDSSLPQPSAQPCLVHGCDRHIPIHATGDGMDRRLARTHYNTEHTATQRAGIPRSALDQVRLHRCDDCCGIYLSSQGRHDCSIDRPSLPVQTMVRLAEQPTQAPASPQSTPEVEALNLAALIGQGVHGDFRHLTTLSKPSAKSTRSSYYGLLKRLLKVIIDVSLSGQIRAAALHGVAICVLLSTAEQLNIDGAMRRISASARLNFLRGMSRGNWAPAIEALNRPAPTIRDDDHQYEPSAAEQALMQADKLRRQHKRASFLASQGALSKAAKVLTAEQTIVPPSLARDAAIQNCFPGRNYDLFDRHVWDRAQAATAAIRDSDEALFTQDELRAAILSAPSMSHGGPSLIRIDHFKSMTGHPGLFPLLHNFLNKAATSRLPTELMDNLLSLDLIAFLKPPNADGSLRVRGISLSQSLWRIVGRVLKSQPSDYTKDRLGRKGQLGAGQPSGTDAMAAAAAAGIANGRIGVKIDLTDGHPRTSRTLGMRQLLNIPQYRSWIPYFYLTYGQSTIVTTPHGQITMEDGVHQGCSLSAPVFGLVTQEVPGLINRAVSGADAMAYEDDTFVLAPELPPGPERARAVLNILNTAEASFSALGYHINPSKLALVACTEAEKQLIMAERPDLDSSQFSNDVVVTGRPISAPGSGDAFVTGYCMDKVAAGGLLFDALQRFPDKFTRGKLIRHCYHPRLAYISRNVDPDLSEAALHAHDRKVHDLMNGLLGRIIPQDTYDEMCLPTRYIGLGLTPLAMVRDINYACALNGIFRTTVRLRGAVRPLVRLMAEVTSATCLGSYSPFVHGARRAVDTTSGILQESIEHLDPSVQDEYMRSNLDVGLIPPHSQRRHTSLFQLMRRDIIYTNMTGRAKARINSVAMRQSNAIHHLIPSESGLQVSNFTYLCHLYNQFGLPAFPIDDTLPCGHCASDQEDVRAHLLSCNNHHDRHTACVAVLQECMEATGHRVTLEQVCLPDEPAGDRYDVTVHDAGDHGEDYAFDFTVGLATAASYVNGSATHPPGWLARRLDRQKADHYRPLAHRAEHPTIFVPAAMEAHGGHGKGLGRFFSLAQKFYDASGQVWSPPNYAAPTFKSYWVQRLAVALARGSADMLRDALGAGFEPALGP